MVDQRIESFTEFWPFYVGEHRLPISRGLHYFGTSCGLILITTAIATLNAWLVPVALVAGYGPAWVAHFGFERNKPASFRYPLWSLRADFKMLGYAIRGKMADEVTRLYGSPAPAPDAPRRPQA